MQNDTPILPWTPPLLQATLTSLPRELLERICLALVCSRLEGPPTGLLSMLLTCRTIRSHLTASNHLYFEIFKSKFDTSAPTRRLGTSWMTVNPVTAELKKRFRLLKLMFVASRVDMFDIQGESDISEILWLAYMMVLESDGKNILQLKYSGLRAYLSAFIRTDMAPAARKRGWPTDTTDRALATNLLWLITEPEEIVNESQQATTTVLSVFRPWALAAYRYDAFHAPPEQLLLPLRNVAPRLAQGSLHPNRVKSLPFSRPTQLTHFGHPLILSSPFTSTGALGIMTSRAEKNPPRPHPQTPPNRAADPNFTRPVISDFEQFSHVKARIPDGTDSTRFDLDWARLVECYNPWSDELQLRTIQPLSAFQAGALSGVWEGRMFYPEVSRYLDILHGRGQEALQPSGPVDTVTSVAPEMWQLEEHHQHNEDYVATDGEVHNGTFLPGTVLQVVDNGITVREPSGLGHPDFTTRYETWMPASTPLPNRPNPRERMPNHLPGGYLENCLCPATYLHGHQTSCEHYNDGMDHQVFSTEFGNARHYNEEEFGAIVDIAITGAPARDRYNWSGAPFTLVGRVRLWDGLVIILKRSLAPNGNTYVFRGYLTGGSNIVGRFRETATSNEINGYEGAFVLTKVR